MKVTHDWTVALTGPENPFCGAIRQRLITEGYRVLSTPVSREASVNGLVIAATRPYGGALETIDIATFIGALDNALCDATAKVRDHHLAGGLRRIVLLASLDARGASKVTAQAAMSGAFTGLARSWALELGIHGITANTLLASSKGISENVVRGVAEATAFLLSPNSGAISGQVLCVSPDTNAGIVPL